MQRALSFGLAIAFIFRMAACDPAQAQSTPSPAARFTETLPTTLTTPILPSSVLRGVLIGAALTGMAFHLERRVDARTLSKRMPGDDFVDVAEIYGDGLCLASVAAGAWGLGAAVNRPGLQTTGKSLIVALAVDGAMVHGLKFAVGRQRPDGSDRKSFPSGHTSSAFTAASVLSRRYGWKVAVPAYAIATFTGIARMEDRRHYPSDVIGGAVLGVIVGRMRTPGRTRSQAGLHPYAGRGGVGLEWRF